MRELRFSSFGLSWRRSAVATVGLWLLALGLRGAPVTAEQAENAVRGWLGGNAAPLRERFAGPVGAARACAGEDGIVRFHVVPMGAGGFVVVAGDDRIEPVLAFSSAGTLEESPENPLWALLVADLPARFALVEALDAPVRSAGAPAGARAAATAAAAKWQALLTSSAAGRGVPAVSDPRVDPLVTSEWGQTTANGTPDNCYNYYTPQNYPCGCVATAMAQLMRYHQWPVGGVGAQEFAILVDDEQTKATTRGGDGEGGAYAWSSMPLVPSSSTTLAQRQAIGALCHDAGLSVGMDYAAGGSGANTTSAAHALVSTFSYANAMAAGSYVGGLAASDLSAMLNCNLDAGFPVLLGILAATAGGHAIVCDGYGYQSATPYHHLNLGWSGDSNAWYCLPTVDTASHRFETVTKVVYNVFPEGTGEIVSGRVLDQAGNPVEGATVSAGARSAQTNRRGIYALVGMAAGQWSITVGRDGYVPASATVTVEASHYSGSLALTHGCGNVWGADFSLAAEEIHALAVANGSGSGSYAPGTVVAVTADEAPNGREFAGWTADPAEYAACLKDPTAASTTLAMPAAAMTLTATYAAHVPYGGGSGTAADPYRIARKTDLLELAGCTKHYGKCFVLTADIDLSGEVFATAVIAPDGNRPKAGFQGVSFTGRFDGNGHVVRNLSIHTDGVGNDYLGLFGRLGAGARLVDLRIEDCAIVGGDYSSYVGGLCGYSDRGIAIGCWAAGSTTGGRCVGGLCGYLCSATVRECGATGSVAGGASVGGLCGYSRYGLARDCYAAATVTGGDHGGGFCGGSRGGRTEGCFWDTEISGLSTSYGGTGRTTAEMQREITFVEAGWDFAGETTNGTDDVWYMRGYPALSRFRPEATRALTVENGVGGGHYAEGETATVTANQAPEGRVFAGWIADPAEYAAGLGDATAARTTFAMPAGAVTLAATCTDAVHTVTFDLGGHGTRTGGGELSQMVAHGAAASAPEFRVADGWEFTGWDGAFDRIAEDLTVTARYAATYLLTVAGGSGGGSYRPGTIVRVAANQAQQGQEFAGWTVDPADYAGNLADTTEPATVFAMPAGAVTMAATYAAYVPYGGGSGTEEDPYRIATKADLLELAARTEDYDKCFLLVADVDLADRIFSTAVIAPDGSNSTDGFQGLPFTGRFDGQGHAVRNLAIDTEGRDNDYLGLFGSLAEGTELKGLAVEDFSIVGGDRSSYVGGLCGYNDCGAIIGCHTAGRASGGSSIGGLCGYSSRGRIAGCRATGSATGIQHVGGLCGRVSGGEVADSHATASATGYAQVGGLCGHVSGGEVADSYATGPATGTGYVGGLCGRIDNGRATGCYAAGPATGSDHVGGLCGGLFGGTANDCYATGPATGSRCVGGLCGEVLWGALGECYATGTATGKAYVGGLCGVLDPDTTLRNCYFHLFGGPNNGYGTPLDSEELLVADSFVGFDFADGTWSVVSGHCPKLGWQTGDGPEPPEPPNTTLAGSGTPADPFLIADATDFAEFRANEALNCGYYSLSCDIDLGGETFAASPINRAFGGTFLGNGHVVRNMTIDTQGASTDCLGLFASVCGTVSELGVEGFSITGTRSVCVGGLCGLSYRATLSRCYAKGSATGNRYVGGLCGYNAYGTITNCYATGSATGRSSVGGLCGYKYEGTLGECYATGMVGGNDDVGGLCGSNNGEMIENCYFHLFGGPANGCGTPLDAEELVVADSFADFDFAEGTWSIVPGHCPKLGWETDYGPEPPAVSLDTTLAGSGTSSDPFLIASAGDFAEFRTNAVLNCGYYSLSCDLDLGGEIFAAAPVNRWFGGTLLGNGHVVRNLTIDTNGEETDYLGFFARLTGTVRDLGIEDVSITGGSGSGYVGGLCGYSSGATVSGCYATGSVTGERCVGGLCGYSRYSAISDCYAMVSVTGSYYYVGGFCGQIYSCTISNCYATGTVAGDYSPGGFCGSRGSSTVAACFWDKETSGISTSDGGTGRTTAQMQTQSTFTDAGWDLVGETANGTDDTWCTQGYPVLIRFASSFSLLTVENGSGSGSYPQGAIATVTANTIPAGQKFTGWTVDPAEYVANLADATATTTTFAIPADDVILTATYGPKYSGGGLGTADAPYGVASRADLLALAADTEDYSKHFVLTTDIDLSGEAFATAVIAPDTNSSTNDFQGTAFTGSFDGDGHLIRNLTIDTDGAGNDYLGLFGKLGEGAEVTRLGLEDLTVTGTDSYYVGGLCGYNYQGTLNQCCATGSITGGRYTGGLCGYNYHGTATNSYVTGPITGDYYTGGLCGYSDYGTLSNCYASVTATGTASRGGLCGNSYSITVAACFWNAESSGCSFSSGGGTGLTTAEMQTRSTFTDAGWDFADETENGTDDTWYMRGYPALSCFRPTTTYTLTVENGTGGGEYGEGETATVTANLATTQAFTGWTVSPADYAANLASSGITPATFAMPAADVTVTATFAWKYSGGGTGTADAPCGIATQADLLRLAESTGDYGLCFVLTADIDLSGETFATAVIAPDTDNSGYGFQGTAFTGSFDGDGHSIRNLNIDTDGVGNDCLGLFGKLGSGAMVTCLGIEDITVTASNSDYVGGLCAENYYGTISKCYATGTVTGSNHIGGLCGYNGYGTISECYATARLTGSNHIGGLCGRSDKGTIESCYFHLFGGPDNGYGTPLDAEEMTDAACFVGFDFADTWSIVSGHCPKLRWATGDGPEPPEDPGTTLAGSGTASDPFLIAGAADFAEFRTNEALIYGFYSLNCDIDLTGETFAVSPVGRTFCGTFLGNGHLVRNLTIDTQDTSTNYLGLFASVSGTIRELGVEGFTITGGRSSNYVGGLCAYLTEGILTHCQATGSATGGFYVGGLCGCSKSGTVSECYATGTATGTFHVGGLCGYSSSSTVANCYASGAATGASSVGGFLGSSSASTVSGCFWDTESSGCSTSSGGGTGLTTAEMQTQSTFTDAGWDFAGETGNGTDDTWYTKGYPALSCFRPATTYALTVENGSGGGEYGEGETATLTALPPDGQKLTCWTVYPAEFAANFADASTTPATFAMPAVDVTITGTYGWKYSGGGCGTESDPYRIATQTDLLELAANTEDYASHFVLTADIDLSGEAFATAVIAADTNNSTSGFQGTVFTGHFDGDGHVVRNLNIDTDGTGNGYLGLFGELGKGAEVTNLGVEDVSVVGSDSYYVGGLCGYSYYGTLSDCSATGTVTGGHYVGGLCGYNYSGTASGCYATGFVAGGDVTGGLCGCSCYGEISDCYATGPVAGGDSTGGLCGRNLSGGISDCYATGSAAGSQYVGGICGYNSSGTIGECYATGSVAGDRDIGGLCGYNDSGTVENGYFYLLGGPNNGLGTPLDAEELVVADSFGGFDFAETWSIASGHCPKLSWETSDGPEPPQAPSTTLAGSGTPSDPFLITDASDFAEFRTNEALICGYYSLTCDIDLSGETFAASPVDRTFGGTLLGNGHAVRNLTIDTGGVSTHYLGLFASVCGTIRDLGAEGVLVTGGSGSDYVGGLCAYLSHGSLAGCHATGTVTGNSYVGGFCGYNYYGTASECYADAIANGDSYVGGFCGANYYGTVSECYGARIATGDTQVGGFCGASYGGTVTECYAMGSVSGGFSTGGFCGANHGSTLSNCYAAGSVSGYYSPYVGGFCGYKSFGTITACFWRMASTGLSTSDGGTGLTAVEMTTQSTFADAGWDLVGETENGADDTWYMKGYPALSCFAPTPFSVLTVANGSGGGSYPQGAIATVTADNAPDGQAFAGWTVEPAEYAASLRDATAATTTFVVPAPDVTLRASYSAVPVAADDSWTGVEDAVLNVAAPGVLANDTDAEGDALVTVLAETPAHGALVLAADGSFSYTPDANWSGTDSFSYRASDGYGGSATVTVTITVSPTNDPPVNTVLPTVSGTALVGGGLTAAKGTWSDSTDTTPGTVFYAYQWRRADDAEGSNATDIDGAADSGYILQEADAGMFVAVRVTATDDGEGTPASQSASADSVWRQVFDLSAALVVTETDGTTAVTEGGAVDSVLVRLATQPSGTVTVTATFGADTEPANTRTATLTFTTENWQDDQILAIQAIDDGIIEGPETDGVQLTATGGGNDGASASVAITVADNDEATVSFAVTESRTGEDAECGIVAVLTIPAGKTLGIDLSVDVAITGGTATADVDYADWTGQCMTLSFPAGSLDGSTQTATLATLPDADLEPDETVELALANPSPGLAVSSPATHVVTIDEYGEAGAWLWTLAGTNCEHGSYSFGMHPDASSDGTLDGLDMAYVFGSPAEADAICRFVADPANPSAATRLRDIRCASADGAVWHFAVSPPLAGDDASLAWEVPEGLPLDASASLVEVDGSGTPVADGIALDMLATTELTISADPTGANRFFRITVAGPEDTFDLMLEPGWNLVSLPIEPTDPSVGSIFSDQRLVAVGHGGVGGSAVRCGSVRIWSDGDKDGVYGYEAATELHFGQGAWVFLDGEEPLTLRIGGTKVADPSLLLHDGWNLVGAGAAESAAPSGAPLGSPICIWQPSLLRYCFVDAFTPGLGHWLHCTAESYTLPLANE